MTRFVKVEGLGNDFVLVDGPASSLPVWQARGPAICDRRRGIGADGILLVGPPQSSQAHATMWVVNHDGSRPQMCGNGLRCVALWIAAQRLSGSAPTAAIDVVIDTDDGPKPCSVELPRGATPAPGVAAPVRVQMGRARHHGSQTPAAGEGRSFATVSMGNPHAITFTSGAEDNEALARRLGPVVAVDPAYPEGTNVEFACVRADGSIQLWVWERGCGITEACGTGACATAAAAVAQGQLGANTPIEVQLPGGTLEIQVPDDDRGSVTMRGPARVVFEGLIPPPR